MQSQRPTKGVTFMIRMWRNLGRALTGGSAALLLMAGTAGAQQPSELEQLRIRLEKLEQQNQELKTALKNIPVQQVGGADAATAPDAKSVEKIVADYLKTQDEKKADAEAA